MWFQGSDVAPSEDNYTTYCLPRGAQRHVPTGGPPPCPAGDSGGPGPWARWAGGCSTHTSASIKAVLMRIWSRALFIPKAPGLGDGGRAPVGAVVGCIGREGVCMTWPWSRGQAVLPACHPAACGPFQRVPSWTPGPRHVTQPPSCEETPENSLPGAWTPISSCRHRPGPSLHGHFNTCCSVSARELPILCSASGAALIQVSVLGPTAFPVFTLFLPEASSLMPTAAAALSPQVQSLGVSRGPSAPDRARVHPLGSPHPAPCP